MAREIVWTKRANRKFNGIIDFLDKEWGENVTRSFVKRTYDLLELILANPEIGNIENREKNIRGFLLTKQNRVFYRVTDTELILLNFFDTRSGSKKKKI